MVRMFLEGASLVVMAAALALAARTDLERRVIPNGCSVAVGVSGLVRAAARRAGGAGAGAVAEAALGVLAVFAVMGLAAAASRRLAGRPGGGGGDVKLLSAAGAWTCPAWGLAVVAGACLTSLALAVTEHILQRLTGQKTVIYGVGATAGGIPLGPGIALITLAVVLLGRP